MQFRDAKALGESTSDEQKETCQHVYEKEYYLSMATGDYVCTKCGDIVLRGGYLRWRKEQSESLEQKND